MPGFSSSHSTLWLLHTSVPASGSHWPAMPQKSTYNNLVYSIAIDLFDFPSSVTCVTLAPHFYFLSFLFYTYIYFFLPSSSCLTTFAFSSSSITLCHSLPSHGQLYFPSYPLCLLTLSLSLSQMFWFKLGNSSQSTQQFFHTWPELHPLSLLGLCHSHICWLW